VQVPCLLRVSERSVLEAFDEGASRIVFTKCIDGDCRFTHAQELVRNRIEHIRAMLSEIGMSDSFKVTASPQTRDEKEVDSR
jgi:F420-non-reducing hydrogenase iron-sulfur subunit